MRVRFWGTRGSVPTPGPATVRFGGNTACVEMRTDGGTFFIFDSGTGIRELGLELVRRGGPVDAHLMLGHTHWDHISGFPFFTPAFVPGNHLTIYGARDLDRSLRDVLAGQMHYTYFPVPLGDLRADIEFCELEEGEIEIKDALVRTHYLNHTAVCMGYRVEADGVSVAYITDHEPYGLLGINGSQVAATVSPGRSGAASEASSGNTGPNGWRAARGGFIHGGDRRLIDFVRSVDLLIQDAQYTPDEYDARRGWGHGSNEYVTDVAVQAGVRRVALFHHEPTHADADIDRMVASARTRARDLGSDVEIFAAAEGQEIALDH